MATLQETRAAVRTIARAATSPRTVHLLNEASARIEARLIVNELRSTIPQLELDMFNSVHPLYVELGERVAVRATPIINTSRVMQEARWRTDLTDAQVQTLIENIITSSGLRAWSGARLTPRFWEHYARVEQQTARVLLRAGLATNLTQQSIEQIIQEGGRRAGLVDIVGDTRTALFKVIQQGVEHGLSPYDTAKLIREFIPDGRFVNAGAGYRAQLIARTETMHAMRAATLARYRANRVPKVIAYDGDYDDICAGRNGQEFTIDEAEDEMSSTHPNCVLTFGPLNTTGEWASI